MPFVSHYEPLADISARLSIPALVFSIATPLIVACRFAARSVRGGDLGADDWIILASSIFTEAVNIQMIICCKWGFGKHTKLIEPPSIVGKTLKLYFFAQILYKIGIGLTKVSILAFYLRVFGVIRWFQISCFVVGGIVVAFSISSVMTSIFQCSPVKYAFDKSGTGTCINLGKFWFANAGYNIGTDILIILLPILVIRTLQLPTRTKVALCAVFALGFFVCATSILRVTTLNVSTAHTDIMWQSISSSMWTVIESNLGIIVACMPALRRPITLFFPMLLGKMGRTTAHRSEGQQAGYGSYKGAGYPSYNGRGMDFEMPGKPLSSSHVRSKSDGLGGMNNKSSAHQQPDILDNEEMGNASDGDQGSDKQILNRSWGSGRKYGGRDITMTKEVIVESGQGNHRKNPMYYPG